MSRLLLLCFAFLLVGCKSKEQENWEDLQKVKIGMSYDEANAIMRHAPFEKRPITEGLLVQRYESVFASSDIYEIYFDNQDSTVVKINYGD